MISFEMPKPLVQTRNVVQTVAVNMMRPVSREMDENEHEIPWSYIEFMHTATKALGSSSMAPDETTKEKEADPEKEKRPPINYQRLMVMVETLSWGDAGIYLCTPGGMLGAAAISAAGTQEQKQRFLSRFKGKEPVFDAMAMTEPQAGSDTSAIRTTAVLDEKTNEWVLNGEKIFVTAGHKALVDSKGFIVVWASLDLQAGRAGIRSFVIEADTPGCKVTKLEEKMGIRASDTVSIVLQDCRIPFENILGSPTIEKSTKGYKGAMQTFDATRPIVAASALGVARAALEFVQEKLAEEGVEIHYGLPKQKMTLVEREIIEMEIQLRQAWLLTVKALWMADNKQSNALISSMSKVKAGKVVTVITQKAVELMGPLGYSRDYLLEKWFRDAKINDIFEGTGQINLLVVARNILGYRGSQLR
jgi:acyl-CoA dehydrogenase